MTDLPRVTGDERADEVLGALGRLDTLPVHGHVAVYEEVHAGLTRVLASVDDPAPRDGLTAGAGTHDAAFDAASGTAPGAAFDAAPGVASTGAPPEAP